MNKSIKCSTDKESFLDFEDKGFTESGKTKRYTVLNRQGLIIGNIHWHGPWRKYVYEASGRQILDHLCMEEIVDFLHKLMDERK